MLKIPSLVGFLLFSAASILSSAAQTAPRESEIASCPRGGFSVYYPRGEASPSEQSMLVVARIGDEALRCQPAGIDLVGEIDSDRDGESAIRLAMARLNNIAETLVASGYPADRIRLAAQASGDSDMRASMGGLTVYFREQGVEAGDASSPVPARSSASTRDSI